MAKKEKKVSVMQAVGKRKKAIARATIRKGTGKLLINKRPLELIDRYRRLRIEEAVFIGKEVMKDVDINVNVSGGGSWGQIDAARTAIVNALVNWSKSPDLRQFYLDYDRSMLISDHRRTEPHKPSRSSAGPRRGKQQSKR